MDKPFSHEPHSSNSKERSSEPKYDVESVQDVDYESIVAVGAGDAEVYISTIDSARQDLDKFDSVERLSKAEELANAMFDGTETASSKKYASKIDDWKAVVVQALTEPEDRFLKRTTRWLGWHLKKNNGKYPSIDKDGNKSTKQAAELANSADKIPLDDLTPEQKRALGLSEASNSTAGSSDATPTTENSRSAEVAEISLDELRRTKRQAFVEKLKSPVFRRAKRTAAMKSFEQAQQAYGIEFEKDFRAKLERELSNKPDMTNAELKSYVENYTNRAAAAERDAQKQILIERYGKIGKALNWYANQNKLTKIAVGAAAGGLALGGGLAVGFLGGLIGTGVAAAGAFGIANRSARQYFTQLSEIFKSQEIQDFALTDGLSRDQILSQSANLARMHMYQMNMSAIEKAEKAKKKAVVYGVGAAALVGLGGVAGAWAHVSTQDIPAVKRPHWLGGQIEHTIDNHAAKIEPKAIGTPAVREVLPAPGPTVVEKEVLDIASYVDSHEAAQHVSKGEGWYQTFKELGMDPSERRAFLKEHGEKLLEMRDDQGRRIAYRMKNGDIGIARPGEMPRSVLEFIAKTAHDEGYIQIDTRVVEEVVSAPAASTTNWIEHSRVITPNESIANTLTEFQNAGVIDSSMTVSAFNSIVNEVGAELANYKYPSGVSVVYRDFLGDWRFNVAGGAGYELPEEVLKKLREAALRNRYTLAA